MSIMASCDASKLSLLELRTSITQLFAHYCYSRDRIKILVIDKTII